MAPWWRDRQRQRAAQQRAAARAAGLGFPSVRAYLLDRLVIQAWTLEEVRGELGAAPTTMRHLLDHYQVRRVAPTGRQRAAATASKGITTQPRVVERRRQARLAELGFAEVDDYWGGLMAADSPSPTRPSEGQHDHRPMVVLDPLQGTVFTPQGREIAMKAVGYFRVDPVDGSWPDPRQRGTRRGRRCPGSPHSIGDG